MTGNTPRDHSGKNVQYFPPSGTYHGTITTCVGKSNGDYNYLEVVVKLDVETEGCPEVKAFVTLPPYASAKAGDFCMRQLATLGLEPDTADHLAPEALGRRVEFNVKQYTENRRENSNFGKVLHKVYLEKALPSADGAEPAPAPPVHIASSEEPPEQAKPKAAEEGVSAMDLLKEAFPDSDA